MLRVVTGAVTADMGLGDDRVRVDGGTATIFGDQGADRFYLYSGTVTIDGGGDNDRFYGNGHAISGDIDGGAGNDAFYDFANAGGLHITLAGGAGNDLYRVQSASGPDIVENPGEGIDTSSWLAASVTVLARTSRILRVVDGLGSGEDATLTGNALANLITGSSGRDTINGMAGNDHLTGGAGNDTINGGDGNDRLIGGLGGDTMTGGAGNDLFVYTSINDSPYANGSYDAEDLITDWTTSDRIDLSAVDANSLLAGQQHFHFAGYGNGHPPTSHNAGDLWLGGFAGELWIIGYTDNDATPDFVVNLFDAAGHDTVSLNNVIL